MEIYYNITVEKRSEIIEQHPRCIFIQKYSDDYGTNEVIFNLKNGRTAGGGYKAEGVAVFCGDIGNVGFGENPIINHLIILTK